MTQQQGRGLRGDSRHGKSSERRDEFGSAEMNTNYGEVGRRKKWRADIGW